MTDRTPNRGYPYPECAPPLVKDQSDIEDLRDLAQAVNTDAQMLDDRIEDLIERPDSARIGFAGVLPVTGSAGTSETVQLIPYNSITYDNTGTSTDLSSFALRVSERGWYLFATQLRCTDGGAQQLSARHVRNGLSFEEGRRFEGQAFPAVGAQSATTTSDVLLCQVGDLIQTQIRTDDDGGGFGNFTFESRLTMVQLVKLDV
jgi:hypothetical protein